PGCAGATEMGENMEEWLRHNAMPASGVTREGSKPEWSGNRQHHVHAVNANRPEQHHQYNLKQCCWIAVLHHHQWFKDLHEQDWQGQLCSFAINDSRMRTDKPFQQPDQCQQQNCWYQGFKGPCHIPGYTFRQT